MLQVIGEGSFGKVYKVKPYKKMTDYPETMVIKELQTDLMQDQEASKIMVEIELLNKLKT